jgi:chitinase
LPVLEILIVVLLLGGAGAAVWILHSSLPGKSTAPASNVEVTISPASAQVVAGKAFDFSATVAGAENVEVTWSVQEGDSGGRVVSRGARAQGGAVSSMAVYIAPDTPGTYHLLATSRADSKKSASAEITVTGQ